MVTRPETDLKFLKLLAGKEHLFHQLAVRDLEQRSLGAETRAAVLNLGDVKSRIARRILQEILEKCMFPVVLQAEASFSGNFHYLG